MSPFTNTKSTFKNEN